VIVPFSIQVQVRNGATGNFVGVYTEPHGPTAFPPEDTLIEGDICYQFQPGQTDMRIYTKFNANGSSCGNRDHLSPFIDICTPNPTCPPSGPQFGDVVQGSTFYADIMNLTSAGAISGYADNTFRPGATVTRGQLAKMVAVAFAVSNNAVSGQAHFSDVPVGSTFYPYIEALYVNGLVSGYGDGTFKPNEAVTRAQVAKIVVRASGLALENPAQPSFSDVPAGSTYYTYVETAKANGILSGYPDGTFHPSDSATRGQIAKLVNRAASPQHPLNDTKPGGK